MHRLAVGAFAGFAALTARLAGWLREKSPYGLSLRSPSIASMRLLRRHILRALDGIVTDIRYSEVAGRVPLDFREMQHFTDIVSARANDIVQKWIDFFVLHKSVKPERITRRLK